VGRAEWGAELQDMYSNDALTGGHIISIGAGNEEAAMSALKNYPGGMQYGGGVNPDNAQKWLDAGASHVIVTSYVFKDGKLDWDKSRARPSARPCSHLLSSACLELVTLVCIHAMGFIST